MYLLLQRIKVLRYFDIEQNYLVFS